MSALSFRAAFAAASRARPPPLYTYLAPRVTERAAPFSIATCSCAAQGSWLPARGYASASTPVPPAAVTPNQRKGKVVVKAKEKAEKEKKGRGALKDTGPLRNIDIPYDLVHLVDAETGKLLPLAPLQPILDKTKFKTHDVELVAHPKFGPEGAGPIVKVVAKPTNLRAAREAARLKPKARAEKEVQLTWGVAGGDLAHKLDRVRAELERGSRVELIFAPKKRTPVPPPAERELRVEESLEMVKDVGREWKARTVEKNVTVLYLQKPT